MNPIATDSREGCAMVGCREPAGAAHLVVNASTPPHAFQIPLCSFCREPFEAGMEAVERLVEGDAEALPLGAGRERGTEMEAER